MYDNELIHALQYFYGCDVKTAKRMCRTKSREFLIEVLLDYRRECVRMFYED